MSKIAITGGLGYIGTQLCKLYASEILDNEITIIDNRFLPERVKELITWGFRYECCDILDKKKIAKLLHDVDIVYHLAGVTDVSYVKSQSSEKIDNLIEQVGIYGSRNVINSIPNSAKIIFPSTHVIYEGFEEATFDITEDVKPCPVLAYSKGKTWTERDLQDSNKDYTVVRLGSAYGYGGDSMRVGIMPNLFSKITATNGLLKLFSGGIQQKCLISVHDVARCMKFMAERNGISRETFNLSNENMTVKQVAEICREVFPSVEIIETDDEIPNEGYTLSNKKLLDSGFRLEYNIEDSIKEMINIWSGRQEKNRKELEYKFSGGKEFIDDRGRITNYELPESVNWIGWIESKKDTIRANHYHPIQEQKCLLVSGKYISVFKDLKDPDACITTQIIEPGDIVVTKPNVAHTMVFVEDSLVLNLVNGEREHENYGKHTIPYVLVDDVLKEELLQNHKFHCRVCSGTKLEPVISLGMSPLANNLLKSDEDIDKLYPLQMNFCPNCYNCQLSHIVNREKMFDNYLYCSSTTESFRDHFNNFAEVLIDRFNLDESSFVLDIGSNDGILLKALKEKEVYAIGIEPAGNLSDAANLNELPTVHGYFEDASVVSKIDRKADVVTALNVFAHSDNLKQITYNAFSVLKPGGQFVIEVQYILNTLKDVTFDNIYHEHYNYWSVLSLHRFFESLDLQICHIEYVETHGGSIRVYIGSKNVSIDPSVAKFMQEELAYGLDKIEPYKKFAEKVLERKKYALGIVKSLKINGKKIVGYGSPAKATTVLNYFGIDNKFIDYIIEDNEMKHGRILPGVRIPIVSKNIAIDSPPDSIIVLAWNFFNYIKKNNQDLLKMGCKFITLNS
ncbi:MAG TPA: NAD-dependent epimerase/dehydratase family protein [Flavobacteriales bacterium]|nr:NAD-dependent epimerase/dehydratase family protein [Flavobacteriales bacterium]